MKYTFKTHKAVLVAGLLAATYAQACYYQTTKSFTCVLGGHTVDKITWLDGTTSGVSADGDWVVQPTSSMVYTSTGVGGRSTVVNGGAAHYCTGRADVEEYLQSNSWLVPSWMGNSVTANAGTLAQPYYSGASATTGGATCQ